MTSAQLYEFYTQFPDSQRPQIVADYFATDDEAAFLARWSGARWSAVADDETDIEFRRQIARHEAAHATVALHFGGQIVSVEVSGSGRGGSCRYRDVPQNREVAVIVAGAVGSDMHLGVPACAGDRRDVLDELRANWRKHATTFADEPDEWDFLAVADDWANVVENIVFYERAAFFHALADALLERGFVGRDECHQLWESFYG